MGYNNDDGYYQKQQQQNDGEVYDDYDDHDQTLPLFFLFFMVLLSVILLLGRALHNRPRLNSYLSEPAMVLIISVCVSFMVKLFHDNVWYTSNSSSSSSQYDDAFYAYNENDDNNNNNNGEQGDQDNYIEVDQDLLSEFLLTFSESFFFMVFLPPIMFHSGYELKRELFFRHIKPIVSFAVLGTALSGIATGMMLLGVTNLGWTGNVQANVWELLAFGSLITATDTVSVLGVLNAKQVDPHLFSLVFGESAFNDAVAIVMFQSFRHLVTMGDLQTQDFIVNESVHFAVYFLLDVLACPVLGVTISFLAALVFKNIEFTGTPVLELTLYILLMYMPFILAEVFGMSGIITIFVTGIFARRYIEPNLTDETKHNAEVIFNLFAYLAELCIFINLGLSVFGFTGHIYWAFTGLAFVASLIGRALSIYGISFLYNWSLKTRMKRRDTTKHHDRRPTVDAITHKDMEDDIAIALSTLENSNSSSSNNDTTHTVRVKDAFDNYVTSEHDYDRDLKNFDDNRTTTTCSSGRSIVQVHPNRQDKVIPANFMHFIWFAGLRGAVAYACVRDFPDEYGNKNEFVAATMIIVLFSIIFMGACCEPLLRFLGIQMGVDNQEYMREWRKRRQLTGRFHSFEQSIHDVVVRGRIDDNDIEMFQKNGYDLTDSDGLIIRPSKSYETATALSTAQRTLTGSALGIMQRFDVRSELER